MSTYLTMFRVGDIVDIKANSSEQKGMPHKCAFLLFIRRRPSRHWHCVPKHRSRSPCYDQGEPT